MIRITEVENIDGKKRIALLDTSSVSFLQRLSEREIAAGEILKPGSAVHDQRWH